MQLATAYDVVNMFIFLPSGGSGRLRREFVEALDVRAGHRALELGCGTGLVTAQLLATGADVVAVDRLPAMLAGARKRAPGATFIEGDAIEAEVGGGYDRAVLSFVLHSFEGDGRVQLLRRTGAALAPGGVIGILDWSLPPGHFRAALWRRFLRVLEPAALSVQQVLAGVLDVDIPASGLQITSRRYVAGGRAQILIVERKSD